MTPDTRDAVTREHTGTEVHPAAGHIVPVRVLAAVLLALLVFTYVTVAATFFDLGRLNLWIALAIATLKATLVALYFMHLRYDQPFNAIVLVCALLFVMLFVGLALMDTLHYAPDLQWVEAPDLQRR